MFLNENTLSSLEKFRIMSKHDKIYADYQKVKQYSLRKDDVVKVVCIDQDESKTVIFHYQVEKAFNYYSNYLKSFNAYVSLGNELDEFIKNGYLTLIKEVDEQNVNKIITTHSHNYDMAI